MRRRSAWMADRYLPGMGGCTPPWSRRSPASETSAPVITGTCPALIRVTGQISMAVRVLPHSPARPADQAAHVPALVLAASLVPAALDLLNLVQPGLGPYLGLAGVVAC